VSDSGASRCCGALGDRALSFGYSLSQIANFHSCALLIGVSDGAHCPLIEEIAIDEGIGR
jgi:hypothetical protein